MMISEFSEKLGRVVVKEMDWEVIEHCYMWHPAFDRTDAKKVAVELYKLMGIRPFLEMYGTATTAKALNQMVVEAKQAYEAAKANYESYMNNNR